MAMRVASVSFFRHCNKVITRHSKSMFQIQSQQAWSTCHLALSYCPNEHVNAIKAKYTSNYMTNQFSTQRQNQKLVRYFPNYVIYNEDATFSLKFAPPLIKRNNQNVNISKKGKLVFEVAPHIEGDTMTDWLRAINIALSVEELGELLCNIAQFKESKFSHMYTQGDTKTITISPNDGDGSCNIMIHAEEQEGESKKESIVISEGEMEVIKNIINITVPNLVAFNTLVEQSITTLINRENNQFSSYDPFHDDYNR